MALFTIALYARVPLGETRRHVHEVCRNYDFKARRSMIIFLNTNFGI